MKTLAQLAEEYRNSSDKLVGYDCTAGYEVEFDDLVTWINQNRDMVAAILDLGDER